MSAGNPTITKIIGNEVHTSTWSEMHKRYMTSIAPLEAQKAFMLTALHSIVAVLYDPDAENISAAEIERLCNAAIQFATGETA